MYFPHIKQHDQADCAAACLAMILKYYKNEQTIMKIREKIGTDAYGTTVSGLVKGAKYYNFSVCAIKLDKTDFKEEFTLPAIAQVINDEGLYHFVVIYKKTNKKIYVADPARQKKTYDIGEFEKNFTGVIVALIPQSNFEISKKPRQSMFRMFSVLMFPQKKELISIIIISIFITITGIFASFFSKVLFDEVIPNSMKNGVYVYLVVFGIISLMQIILKGLRRYSILHLSRKIDIPILLGYYKHVINLPINFFANRKTGDIIARFRDAMTIKDIFTKVSVTLAMDIIMVCCTGIILFNMNPFLFLIIVIVTIINVILIFMFKKPYKELNYIQMENSAKMNSQLIESLHNINSIKALSDEEVQINLLEKNFISVLKTGYREGVLQCIQEMLSHGVGTLGQLIFMSIGALSIMNGQLTVGTLIVFQTLSVYFIEPINNLVELQITYQEAKISLDRLQEIMEVDREDLNDNSVKEFSLDRDIHFNDVTFQYGSRAPIIKNLDLKIKKGEKIALVGESGAGKSTLLKILLKFYDVSEGKVLIGSHDIMDLDIQKVRKKIGYVPQNIELFSGTILDNIKQGSREASYEEVIRASKKAGAHQFIEKMSNRYNSIVEENGNNLSNGEKQRIALARVLLQNPDIYVFDEATSSLDSFSEETVQRAIFQQTKGKTTIIIAHRLSTIINVDKIIVFQKGKIIEVGSHEELIELNQVYAQLFYKQTKYVISEETVNPEKIEMEEIVYA